MRSNWLENAMRQTADRLHATSKKTDRPGRRFGFTLAVPARDPFPDDDDDTLPDDDSYETGEND